MEGDNEGAKLVTNTSSPLGSFVQSITTSPPVEKVTDVENNVISNNQGELIDINNNNLIHGVAKLLRSATGLSSIVDGIFNNTTAHNASPVAFPGVVAGLVGDRGSTASEVPQQWWYTTPEPFANNTTNATETEVEPQTVVTVVIISIVVTILAILTAGGNLMVMISFKMDKQLQTVSNYFLLSLSIADFFIGVFSMPLYTVYLLMKWPLGPLVCDIWLSLDYTMSNASVANLLLISFDRYFFCDKTADLSGQKDPTEGSRYD